MNKAFRAEFYQLVEEVALEQEMTAVAELDLDDLELNLIRSRTLALQKLLSQHKE